MSNSRIIDEIHKYDGSKESKERLCFLFMVTYHNIQNFVDWGNDYKKYIAEHLNQKLIEFNNDANKLTNYYNNEFKYKDSSNIYELSVKLFNVLSSFYSLKQYITYDNEDKKLYRQQRQQLSNFNQVLNSKLNARFFEKRSGINISDFLIDCRNILVHKGKIICHFQFLQNNAETKNIPAFVIPVSKIWNDDYLNEINLSKDYCLDTFEVFENILSCFNQLQILLDDIVSN